MSNVDVLRGGKVGKKTRPKSVGATKMIMSKTHSSNINAKGDKGDNNKIHKGNKAYMYPIGVDHNNIVSNDDLKPDTVRINQKKNKNYTTQNIAESKIEQDDTINNLNNNSY